MAGWLVAYRLTSTRTCCIRTGSFTLLPAPSLGSNSLTSFLTVLIGTFMSLRSYAV